MLARLQSIIATSRMADVCGHLDRPGNASGFCDECWAVFASEQGFGEDRELITWDKTQAALSILWEDPKLQHRVLGRRMRALKAKLAFQLPIYADLHLRASRAAAEKGDTRPMEWMLTHIQADKERVVELQKGSAELPDNGVKVFIGVKVGGLPPSDGAEVVEAEVVGADGQK